MDVEVTLHDFIDDRLEEIRSTPALIDLIFEDRATTRREEIKKWLTTTQIRTVLHHPRDESEIPCYALVLQNEGESDQVIGSIGDQYDETLISRMEDGWIGSDSDILRTDIYADTTIVQYYAQLEEKNGRRVCHMVGLKDECDNKGIWIDYEHSVLAIPDLDKMDYIVLRLKSSRIGSFLRFGLGKDAHDEYTFSVAISVCNAWERILVDIRGVPVDVKQSVHFMSLVVTDDSSYINVYVDELKAQKALGEEWAEYYFDNVYRIESWSNNAELTVVMNRIISWNLLRYRDYLETTCGFYRQRIEGGDIMPQPEFYPEFMYIRGLTYSCSIVEMVPKDTDLSIITLEVSKIDFGHGMGG